MLLFRRKVRVVVEALTVSEVVTEIGASIIAIKIAAAASEAIARAVNSSEWLLCAKYCLF